MKKEDELETFFSRSDLTSRVGKWKQKAKDTAKKIGRVFDVALFSKIVQAMLAAYEMRWTLLLQRKLLEEFDIPVTEEAIVALSKKDGVKEEHSVHAARMKYVSTCRG